MAQQILPELLYFTLNLTELRRTTVARKLVPKWLHFTYVATSSYCSHLEQRHTGRKQHRSGSTRASMLGTRVVVFNFRIVRNCCRSSKGMMRSFSALLLLASSHPSRSAFLSHKQCSKRMLHSPFTRALKAVHQSDESETASRNFITNLIEDDIKENKVWYLISLLTILSKKDIFICVFNYRFLCHNRRR